VSARLWGLLHRAVDLDADSDTRWVATAAEGGR
jgi:hypothetical protein